MKYYREEIIKALTIISETCSECKDCDDCPFYIAEEYPGRFGGVCSFEVLAPSKIPIKHEDDTWRAVEWSKEE